MAKLTTLEKLSSSRNAATFTALLLLFVLAHAAWADDWKLKGTNGTHYTLSGLHGKWVLINFWAPWCPPCLQEIPDLVALQQQHRDIQVIGVAVMYANRKKVSDAVAKLSITYPVVFGTEDTAGDFGGLDGLPTSFLYSPSGKLIGHHQGILTKQDMELIFRQNTDPDGLFTR